MPDIYELTNEELNRAAKNLFIRIPVYNPEIIRYTALLKDIDSKLFDNIHVLAESSIRNKLSNAAVKKNIDQMKIILNDPKNPFKVRDAYIKKRYSNFINQYKNYFIKNNILTPKNFEEFSFWFTVCLHPTKILFQLDIKDSDFKLFHDYKERLFNDNNWDEYKEAHLLDFYNTDIIILLSSSVIKEKREYRKLKKRISTSIYQNILEQYEIYFDKLFSKNPNSFKLFIMWFARCLHPNESLENIDVTDKDIYQFIEYIDIKENDIDWSDVQERERLKQYLNKKIQVEQSIGSKDDEITSTHTSYTSEAALIKLKVEDSKSMQLKDKTIYIDKLAEYFHPLFKGRGNNTYDYFSQLLQDVKLLKTEKEIGQVALMLYESKHLNSLRPNDFTTWYRLFGNCVGGKETYKKGQLKHPKKRIKELFNYIEPREL